MKKRDLIQAVATHTDVDKKTATALVEGTIDVILATVAKGEIVNISGFAKFAKINRPARMARNPATGEQIKVKAKTVAKITALKGFPWRSTSTKVGHRSQASTSTSQKGSTCQESCCKEASS
jgi:DNA-binding protein HU-beta